MGRLVGVFMRLLVGFDRMIRRSGEEDGNYLRKSNRDHIDDVIYERGSRWRVT
jgi:hypothetical protein